MATPEQKAIDLMAQADKKCQSKGGFLGFFGGSNKQEEAAELYVKAANTFKIAKKWAAAGEAFTKSAQLQISLKSNHEAATHFVDAANCYKKTDPNEAVTCLLKATEIYTDMGRFTIAAKHNISIAEIYESELVDIDKAIAYYEQAADFYKGEESNSSANKCLLKVAQYAAQQEQYDKAIEIYEQQANATANQKIVRYAAEDMYFRAALCHMCLDPTSAAEALESYVQAFPALEDTRKHKLLKVATSAMDNQLLRYSAKDYFFRALLCRMCQEIDDAATTLTKYEEMFPAFSDSRECKLVKNLLAACEEQNADAYTDAVKEYDSISRLDQWYTTILLRIKKSIEGDVDLR